MDTNTQSPINPIDGMGNANGMSNNGSYIPPMNVPVGTNSQNTFGGRKIGAMISILVVVLILALAALYIFASSGSSDTVAPSDMTASENTASQNVTEVQPVTNTADDVQSLENDLNSAIEGLDEQNF